MIGPEIVPLASVNLRPSLAQIAEEESAARHLSTCRLPVRGTQAGKLYRWRLIRYSHKGVILTSAWRPRLVLGKLDKSLERQENRRSCWRFLGQDILICIINKMVRALRAGHYAAAADSRPREHARASACPDQQPR